MEAQERDDNRNHKQTLFVMIGASGSTASATVRPRPTGRNLIGLENPQSASAPRPVSPVAAPAPANARGETVRGPRTWRAPRLADADFLDALLGGMGVRHRSLSLRDQLIELLEDARRNPQPEQGNNT